MTKKPKDDLFPYLNWLIKKNNIQPSSNIPSSFIVNRWLSMLDDSYAQIVNVTVNRWLKHTCLNKYPESVGYFYRTILPKVNKKFSYIKKQNKETTEQEELTNYASSMEISQKELLAYNQLLEDFNIKIK
jgi:hypothetical protein